MIISHINPDNWELQSNEEHSKGVAEFASSFANQFGFGKWGYLVGILHDKGKEQKDFQKYIQKVSGYKPELTSVTHVNHAYVGALIANQMFPNLKSILCNIIMGHHAGLYNYNEMDEVLNKAIPSDVSTDVAKEKLKLPQDNDWKVFQINHLIRVLYSCLVDADYLDTERFMNKEHFALRKNKTKLEDLRPLLDAKMFELKKSSKSTPLNIIRSEIQQECFKASSLEPGFFSLTVPTGGGKTLSSLVWAINHAIKYNKKRIIIAIPYTSIIVQTASILRRIFGEENVLEHHSNVEPDNIKDLNVGEKMKLATENWDYPIIVTTNVQLFESMYSNKPSKCRKLHNICNSVIILDEVQTLPIDYLQPIVKALKTYQHVFGCSVLFTTASQPVLSGRHRGVNDRVVLEGIATIKEIIPYSFNLSDKLRRVELHFDKKASSYDTIAERLSKYNKVLCIVNTRAKAKEIYTKLPQEEGALTLHLSRMMCPMHIKKTIEIIKSALKNDAVKSIRVIATQLIEAGVDIDFPVVFREEAGLDSILQAAGRCNREGKAEMGHAYVFKTEKPLFGYVNTANNARLNMQSSYTDYFAADTMNEYFEQLYCRSQCFDKAEIHEKLEQNMNFCFKDAAESFKLIDDAGSKNVIVNWGDSMELCEQLKKEGPHYILMKKLSQYSVSMRRKDFQKLFKDGLIIEIFEGIYAMPDREQYDDNIGVVIDNHWLDEILIK